ncbi:NAD(P)-dependent alcohol dehydrogenase [Microbacterium gallinarum]|uniref:NAD(P)-dependent alcohol dehydrogenase n=1 Tax=Microbacterium gallinarum TaxID=2762209 RepID=A0ABR8X1D8_9MICO|nr:NAD(P)-dependent alcohol dehydrogenase [Microbacterium gallinarum]MBD8022706.1 NAD(P)-dependent alcohol dehydrogenase [Microbacterium gallinarum]
MTATSPGARDASISTDTMHAWVQRTYGGPETVRPERIDVPAPGRGEVLLRLRATGVNNGDTRVMRGEPLLLRLAFGLRRPKQPVRGMDAAGTVIALGDGVTGFAPGDEVVCELPGGGGLAGYAVAPVKRLVRRPAALDAVVAAALPIAGGTAWQALERGGVAEGMRILVIGASGGVGTFTVQLATLRGAEVWALCGERSRELVERLGASRTFDYRTVQPGSPELGGEAFDVVIDIAGTSSLRSLQSLVRDGGAVVLVSGEGGRFLGPIGRILAATIRSIGSKRPLRPLAAVAKPDVLAELLALAADERLVPVIERTWPLAEAREALAHVDGRHAVGKTVVTIV